SSYRAIATDVGISKTSVQRALEIFEEIGGFRDRSRSGRPKKLNERNVRMLKPLAKDDDNRSSARELMVKLNESLDKPICRRTIINYLQKCGYEYKIKIEKPFLNKENRKARLQWCLEHSNWTVDEWKKVLFSDESTFYVIKRKSETKIWRTKDEQWKEGCMAVAATGGGGRVGFWSVITWQGTGCFRVYSENTNSDVYCDILDNYLVPTLQLYGLEDNFMFQHDSARYHTSKQTDGKLQELNVKVLKWPAKSPDLNPIEHLWSIIDNKLKSRRMCSVKDLTDGLSAEWLSITQELCEKLVFSMPQRIQKCIAVNGKCIDY
ncbi:unnamed protein product, partial [Rotaria sp. Silwood2]